MGAYLNSDPVWFRILFVVFALMFGFGFFVYLALWIALPSSTTANEIKKHMTLHQAALHFMVIPGK